MAYQVAGERGEVERAEQRQRQRNEVIALAAVLGGHDARIIASIAAELRNHAGTQFDSDVVDALLRVVGHEPPGGRAM